MKKLLIALLILISAALVFSGCKAAEPELNDISWEWESLELNDGSTVTVDDPTKYTLVLREDGTFYGMADCNSVQGAYTMEDSSITIEPGPTTLAFCGEDSLDTMYLERLETVVTYVLSEGKLYLNLMYDSGNMVFRNGGKI